MGSVTCESVLYRSGAVPVSASRAVGHGRPSGWASSWPIKCRVSGEKWVDIQYPFQASVLD